MDVIAEWERLDEPTHPSWLSTRRVYALSFDAQPSDIVYIGIAAEPGSSVRARRLAHRERFSQALARAGATDFHALAAKLTVPDAGRVTIPLLRDVERLLTFQLAPLLNAQNRQRYDGRAQLRLRCTGAWPSQDRHTFIAPGWREPAAPTLCPVCSQACPPHWRYCGQCGAQQTP